MKLDRSTLKRKITAFIYSFILILVWGIGCIDMHADSITAGLVLIFTFAGTYFLRVKMNFDFYDKLIVLLFPTLYFIAFVQIWESFSANVFNNPLTIGLVFLILSLTFLKDLTKSENVFIFLFCTVLYSHRFYPIWANEGNPIQVVSIEESLNGKVNVVSDTIRVQDYAFVNKAGEKINLTLNGKYTLLETWSEGCSPCIKAFIDLAPFYQEQQGNLRTFYVYENRRESARKDVEKIFNYRYIKDRSKILIDVDQNLYQESKMTGYPYFLLFNPAGELVYSQKGYNSEIRDAFEDKILSKMGER